MRVDLTAVIPTRGRPHKVAACVAALSRQTLDPDSYEVLIGLDGEDPQTRRSAEEAWPDPAGSLRVVTCPREGLNRVRNRLLETCRGRTIVSLNDDVLPVPAFLETHLRAQREAEQAGRPAIVVGRSPWVRHEPDRLFDRLVRETSMVFFYDRMDGADPGRDWGFRHAWGLNMSMPAAALAEAGGWTAFPMEYGYDDIEIAWRLRLPVLYRPEALAPHDHRMEPRGYLEREFALGRAAWLFARRSPRFGRDVFGRDVAGADEIEYSRAFIERERAAAAAALGPFLGLTDMPADSLSGPHAQALLTMLYQQHLPLKRWMWRAGLLAAAEGRPPGAAAWPDRPAPIDSARDACERDTSGHGAAARPRQVSASRGRSSSS